MAGLEAGFAVSWSKGVFRRLTQTGCRDDFDFASHQPWTLSKADLSNRSIVLTRDRRDDQDADGSQFWICGAEFYGS
jgi:hypothetical protein